jgi:hypothetical protein
LFLLIVFDSDGIAPLLDGETHRAAPIRRPFIFPFGNQAN